MNFDDHDHDHDDDDDDDDGTMTSFFQGRRTFSVLVGDAMSVLAEICLKYRPEGRFYRGEYMSHHPDHEDEPASLCINLQTGRWSDIAANAQGFDPVTYYAHVMGLSLAAAIRALNKDLDALFGDPEPPVLM